MVNVVISQGTQANIQLFLEFVHALDKGDIRTLENVRIGHKTLENEVSTCALSLEQWLSPLATPWNLMPVTPS